MLLLPARRREPHAAKMRRTKDVMGSYTSAGKKQHHHPPNEEVDPYKNDKN